MDTVKLELTPQEIVTIGKALTNMPYVEVVALIQKLQTQINEQAVTVIEKVENDTAGK